MVRPKAFRSGCPKDHPGSRLLDVQLESKHYFYLHPLVDSEMYILSKTAHGVMLYFMSLSMMMRHHVSLFRRSLWL